MFGGPLTRQSAEQGSRLLFIGGFFALPLLWAVNALTFWGGREKSAVVRWYVDRSAIAFILALVAAIIYWIVLSEAAPNSSLWWDLSKTTAVIDAAFSE